MVRVLCDLPIECLDDLANLRGIDLVTFGMPDRMPVELVPQPFTVTFDSSRGTWQQLAAALPRGFTPDLVLFFHPEQEPLPGGMHLCAVPVVGVISDYQLTLPNLTALQPCFDVLLCDRHGVQIFARLGHNDVRWFCQYTHNRRLHRRIPGVARDLDVGFAGILNPAVQRDHAGWLARLGNLGTRGIRVEVRHGLYGDGYARFLNRTKSASIGRSTAN
ncbi:hypothetical protein LBMAG49_16020 [Planctomycetota bacterium]|nr:hypothetical protein LBMAG49_16020 [Planctomycetota bacterium]